MLRKVSMSVLLGALGCAAALALLAGHGLAQQNATFNSYWFDDGWLNVPDGRRMGLTARGSDAIGQGSDRSEASTGR
jgi:hypothetical protein